MTSLPEVSIITANYNKGKDVVECVTSVLGQSNPNWEFYFIDDGSDDGSFELAKQAASKDARCHFLINETGTKGANAARNMALELSLGSTVIFLDSDDVMLPNCIEHRLTDFKKYPEADYLVYPMGIFFDSVGDSDLICNIPTNQDDLHRFLDRDIVWLISGPIWKKSALKSLGGFDLSLHSQQDYDLHVRALILGLPYKYLHSSPDIYYRRNVLSLPRQNSQSIEHFRQRYLMILRHHQLLVEHKKLDASAKKMLSRYLLDLAQMMRWHIGSLGKKEALHEALAFWNTAEELSLLSKVEQNLGTKYVRFKHQMLFNRLPMMQRWRDIGLQKKLGDLIFKQSTTYCQVTLNDYEGR